MIMNLRVRTDTRVLDVLELNDVFTHDNSIGCCKWMADDTMHLVILSFKLSSTCVLQMSTQS